MKLIKEMEHFMDQKLIFNYLMSLKELINQELFNAILICQLDLIYNIKLKKKQKKRMQKKKK